MMAVNEFLGDGCIDLLDEADLPQFEVGTDEARCARQTFCWCSPWASPIELQRIHVYPA